jgi:hypothetical protein
MPTNQALHKQAAGFIETMDCLPVSRLPEGPEWTYEIKLDGCRLVDVQSAGRTTLYSRRRDVDGSSSFCRDLGFEKRIASKRFITLFRVIEAVACRT